LLNCPAAKCPPANRLPGAIGALPVLTLSVCQMSLLLLAIKLTRWRKTVLRLFSEANFKDKFPGRWCVAEPVHQNFECFLPAWVIETCGQGDQIGLILVDCSFWAILWKLYIEVTQIFGQLFKLYLKVMHSFWQKNELGYILGDFLTN
jgi:hypothetical protein